MKYLEKFYILTPFQFITYNSKEEKITAVMLHTALSKCIQGRIEMQVSVTFKSI